MPFRRRFNYAPRYRRRRYNNFRKRGVGLATRPRMMSRAYKWKRYNQVDTRTAWFKINGTIGINANQSQYYEFRTSFLPSSNPNGWSQYTTLYDQYKILGFVYKLFPSNVGTEATSQVGQPSIHFNRGDHCLWLDQRFDPNVVQPSQIGEVINTASARLINPRRPYKISIWRPRGKPQWGSTRDIINNGDAWTGSINHLINGATPQLPPLLPKPCYFYTIQYKVIFRGRQDD